MIARCRALTTPVLFIFFASLPANSQKYAPLPNDITNAKTVYLVNQTIEPKVADKAWKELQKWGRFEVVDDMEKADLVFRFRHPSRDAFAVIPFGPGVVRNDFVMLEIFNPQKSKQFPLWTVTKGGTLLVSNSGKDCIKELRKRFPKDK